ncbi:hypothetical protein U1Q18_026059 [Sarracenia purpurea var. burkii]
MHRASAVTPRGRGGGGSSSSGRTHRRLGEDGARNGTDGGSREERGADGRRVDGIRTPAAESAPVAEEVFRAASIWDEGYTGVGFIE